MTKTILDMLYMLKDGNHPQLDPVLGFSDWVVLEVPAQLRAQTPASFENNSLELGLHRRSLQTSQTELCKFELARLVHSKLITSNSSWGHFACEVVSDVEKARDIYSGSSDRYTDEEIQNLLALDALFLVVLFKFLNGQRFFRKEFEALGKQLSEIIVVTVMGDFFLLENQVPTYLLRSVIKQLFMNDEDTREKISRDPGFKIEELLEDELEKVLFEAVCALSPFTYPQRNVLSHFQNRTGRLHDHLIKTYPIVPLKKSLINCKHLLDCIYKVVCGHSFTSKIAEIVEPSLPLESIPCASRLQTVGIRIVGAAQTVSGIRLCGKGYLRSAKLELPRVQLYDYSEAAFRNLALYEQQTFGAVCADFRCYLHCMASLCIDLADIQLLAEQGVITNHMGNSNVVGMWERCLLGLSVPLPSNAWAECYTRIHNHRNSVFKQWRQEFWVLFFGRPWRLVSVLVGILLLFLSAVQTWLTAFPPQCAKPN